MIDDGFGNNYDNINLDNDVLQQAKGFHTLFTSVHADPALGDPNNNGLKDFIGGFIEFNLYIMLYIALIVTMVGIALLGGCIIRGFLALNTVTKENNKEIDLELQAQPMKPLYTPSAPNN